jgi:hypothetical protein
VRSRRSALKLRHEDLAGVLNRSLPLVKLLNFNKLLTSRWRSYRGTYPPPPWCGEVTQETRVFPVAAFLLAFNQNML